MNTVTNPDQVRIYQKRDAVVFRKTAAEFGGLSNMAPGFPLKVNDVRIPTSEALYQACRFPHSPDLQQLIIEQNSPMTAKMKSKPHRGESRPDWDKVRVNVMRWCLRVKLAQNWHSFRPLLLSTGDRPIVEESPKDDFWGAKPKIDDTLVGMNVLGRLLMELRKELTESPAERSSGVEPLRIPEFMFMGQPIGVVSDAGLGVPVQPGLASINTGHDAPTVTSASVDASRPMSEPLTEPMEHSMIPRECKRLAEVDFPIAIVSKHAVREKSIRHGHPSTLHLWWARRPLASSRAMLLALLLPDPCDPYCSTEFKDRARKALGDLQKVGPSDSDLRLSLLKFIGDFANWDLASNARYIEAGQSLVRAAYQDEPPVVVDPFAGGGSIPLEALRLGCEVYASDLNPLAFAILRTLLVEAPRRHELPDEVQALGSKILKRARTRLEAYYPGGSETTPIGYLWARAVRCEAPACGAEVPIFKSAWLSKKGTTGARFFQESSEGNCIALLMDSTPRGGPISFRIAKGYGSTSARAGFTELAATKAPGNNQNVLCPCCDQLLRGDRVMAQLAEQRGGADTIFNAAGERVGGAYLLTVIESQTQTRGKFFRLATRKDYSAVYAASIVKMQLPTGLSAVINSTRPSPSARGLTAPVRYGATQFGDLFTTRQKLALHTLSSELEREIADRGGLDGPTLAATLGLGRCIDQSSAHVRWLAGIEAIASSFPRQALQMTWDFVESVPTGRESANYAAAMEWVRKVLVELGKSGIKPGQVSQGDARRALLPYDTVDLYFTDPPYYDAVPYADLSDFFLAWLGPLLQKDPNVRLDHGLSPKAAECVWNRAHNVDGQPKDPAFFEDCVGAAFDTGRNLLKSDGIASVVFAHKTTEGWEALLGGLRRAGLVIVASWPIATERSARTNAQNTASLSASVHLVCRPRIEETTGDWGEALHQLPIRVGEWMDRLQAEGVRGADLVFACIGPALEIYSRYARVETAEGREIPLAEYLEKVWEVVGKAALTQILGSEGDTGTLEEDARLVALFLWTLQSTAGLNGANADSADEPTEDEPVDDEGEDEGASNAKKAKGFTLVYDVVRRFAQPLGIRLDDWERRIIETKKGSVRLLPVSERAEQLFGEDGAHAAADQLEAPGASPQLALFPGMEPAVLKPKRGRKKVVVTATDDTLAERRGATTLDRIHAAMLLQASGRANALRSLLAAEVDRGPEFLRLANALSALYPRDSEEKRLLDAMLLAVPR